MLEIEEKIYELGYSFIACIDEVGRGCLAGDVIACAIIMPRGLRINGVKDSKKLTQKKRESLYDEILTNSLAYGIGRVDSAVIDKINIKESTRLAMQKAVENLKDRNGISVTVDFLLIDAETIDVNIPQEAIIKGDDKSHGIACASIIAKVFRDRLCIEWDQQYQGYNLQKHKGYGTKEHIGYIKEIGPSPIHRLTFLKNIIK
ncbi:ribonuclease HII [Tissierella sp.]|uniref:ribonuclease HII n=1 Tax=Tissierella sp. TaxID=41274 RepID=UPI0028614610|nr:ribonuclease HII [Tissierella sp.]MDR7856353.1 ribonuclease HII [Tissierella sp.]